MIRIKSYLLAAVMLFLPVLAVMAGASSKMVDHLQGEMAGEVSSTSAVLQSRLTVSERSADRDVKGAPGVARFEIARIPDFAVSQKTGWQEAVPDRDYYVRERVDGLEPDTEYFYRLEFGPDRDHIEAGPVRRFRTLPGAEISRKYTLAVITCLNEDKFESGKNAYQGADKALGFPGLVALKDAAPEFVVFTGDNVYYDKGVTAYTQKAMRTKWHRVFSQPRMVDFLAVTPAYFEKDDHDYRFNDCDNTGLKLPSPRIGRDTFLEQVPAPGVTTGELPYRTHRVTKELQIWLVEGRDFRSPNRSPDGPAKTLWGAEQREWLMRTLKESDAAIKLVISPTPLIGPDDAYKKDNHVGGFKYERDLFFDWAKEQGLDRRGMYFICGDRHWQYHSVHPLGFEEFSVGTLADSNARMGRDPGDPKSTDPEARIKQLYTSPEPSGGFLLVTVEPGEGEASAVFELRDEHGERMYLVERGGRQE